MPEMTYALDPNASTVPNGGMVSVFAGSVTVAYDRIPHKMPPAIPRSQEYFWSVQWQKGEHAADADFSAGRSRVFDDPTTAVQWLLSAEE